MFPFQYKPGGSNVQAVCAAAPRPVKFSERVARAEAGVYRLTGSG